MRSRTGVLEPAFILHSRPYGDTSSIVELLTLNEGRFSVVSKGARAEKSKLRGRLEPFTPMLIAAVGRGELKTATKIEFPGRRYHLMGENLLLGMYINELLYRLLEKFYPVANLFESYEALLSSLQGTSDSILAVRTFEVRLLDELGYGISFDYDARDGQAVESEQHYRFVTEEGFHRVEEPRVEEHSDDLFTGKELLDLAVGNFSQVDARRLRNLTRKSLNSLLGDRPLKSRSMFKSIAR